jgi:hypothetical protein
MAPEVHSNAEGVKAPDATKMRDFWISGHPKGLVVKVASGDISKKGWEQVLQIPPGQSGKPNWNLEESIIKMTTDSPFVKAFFRGLLEARKAGKTKRLPHINSITRAITDHQTAWTQEGLSNMQSGLLDGDKAVAAGAIYYMSRKIPKNSSSDQAAYDFRWHPYYDSFNDEVLYNVLHQFLMYLRRVSMKSASGFSTVARTGPLAKERHWEASLGKRLRDAVYVAEEPLLDADDTALQNSNEQRRSRYALSGVHVYTIRDEDSEDDTGSPGGVHVYMLETDDSDRDG